MIKAFLRIETPRTFAGGDAAVPLVGHEIRAAKQVLGFGVGRRVAGLLLQKLDRFIHVAGGK